MMSSHAGSLLRGVLLELETAPATLCNFFTQQCQHKQAQVKVVLLVRGEGEN